MLLVQKQFNRLFKHCVKGYFKALPFCVKKTVKKLPLLHQQNCNGFYGLIPTARQHAIAWSQEPCHV